MTLNRRDFFKGLGAVAGGAAALAAGVRNTIGEAREYNKQVQTFADAIRKADNATPASRS